GSGPRSLAARRSGRDEPRDRRPRARRFGRRLSPAFAPRAAAASLGARAAPPRLRRWDGRMTESDPLLKLRALPLPEVPAALTAKIKERAHAELRSPRTTEHSVARALAVAAVVALCVSHLGWTVAFLAKMHALSSAPVAARVVPR